MYESAAVFAKKLLSDYKSLDQFVVTLDDSWLLATAEAFANLGCTVLVDMQSKVLTISNKAAADLATRA
jgi:hypothetical protein